MHCTLYIHWSCWKHINGSLQDQRRSGVSLKVHILIFCSCNWGASGHVTRDNFPFKQTLISSTLIQILHLTQVRSWSNLKSISQLSGTPTGADRACDIGEIITSRENNNMPLNCSGWPSYSTCSFRLRSRLLHFESARSVYIQFENTVPVYIAWYGKSNAWQWKSLAEEDKVYNKRHFTTFQFFLNTSPTITLESCSLDLSQVHQNLTH